MSFALTMPQSGAGAPVERLATALRDEELGMFHAASPFAACLMPLLQALRWHGISRDVAEALPHFAETLDLIDLRNVLVSLGYESTAGKTSLSKLDPRLLPCLWVGRDGTVCVLTGVTDGGFQAFDGRTRLYVTLLRDASRGTAFYFTEIDASRDDATGVAEANWFGKLIRRFKSQIFQLLAITFFLNILAMVVPIYIMVVYDKVIGAKAPESLMPLFIGVVMALVADGVLRHLRAKSMGALAGRLDYLLGVEAFGRIIGLPPLFTERSTIGAQTSRLKEFENIRELFLGPLATIFLEVPFTVLYIVVIALLGGPIAVIPVALIGAFTVFGIIWFPKMRRVGAASAKAQTTKITFLAETMRHLQSIKFGSNRDVWRERYRAISSQAVAAQNTVANVAVISQTFAHLLMFIAGIGVLWGGTLRILTGDMSLGAMIAVMALVWRVLSPLQAGFLAFTKLQQVMAGVRHINGLMGLKPETQKGGSGLLTRRIEGRISLNRVSFRYGPESDPALLGVSLAIEPGEMVAVTGSNGSGKSTVLKMIAGLYAPQGGTLAIDGTDIRQIDPLELRRIVAYVQQTPALFHGTVAQNLRMSDPTACDSQLAKAAAEVGILSTILSMPEGFDTKLSDAKRDHLPIGFFQRLVVARALVRESPILLMDEPATALDDEGDRMLVDLLGRLKGTCTMLMISHRPSHIRLADKAIVLDKATVVHFGTPDEALDLMFGQQAAA